MLKMTKEQLKHYPAVKRQLNGGDACQWLYHGERGSGRSTAMCVAFISKAVREEGKPVSIYDHVFFSTYTRHSFRETMMATIRAMELDTADFSFSDDLTEMTYKPVVRAAQDEYPPEVVYMVEVIRAGANSRQGLTKQQCWELLVKWDEVRR